MARKQTSPAQALWREILSAAAYHGRESDPDHEVGDLQDALLAALEHVPVEALPKVAADLADFFEQWGD